MAVFKTQIELSTTPEALFDFLIRPSNMVELAPPGTSITLIDAPDVLTAGCEIEFDVFGLGPTQRFIHEIVECERPLRIVERQLEGPFKSFHHEVELKPAGNGTVTLFDRIVFEPPGGLVGLLLTEARIRQYLETGYAHRQTELRQMFST